MSMLPETGDGTTDILCEGRPIHGVHRHHHKVARKSVLTLLHIAFRLFGVVLATDLE